jgi:uncharacterized protein YfaP (DUF2135 family)
LLLRTPPRTRSGGILSRDVTQGYGPEMYVHPRAPKGTYTLFANYYSNNQDRVSTRTKVYATIYRKWGSPEEEAFRKVVTLQKVQGKQELMVLEMD